MAQLNCTTAEAPTTWTEGSEFRVSGWETEGDWGSKSTCFGAGRTEPESIWFCCVYTTRPAGENGSALAKTNCSLPVSPLLLSAAAQFSLILLSVQRESEWDASAIGTVCGCRWLRQVMKPEPVFSLGAFLKWNCQPRWMCPFRGNTMKLNMKDFVRLSLNCAVSPRAEWQL